MHVNREGNYVEVDLFTEGSAFAVRVRCHVSRCSFPLMGYRCRSLLS